MSGYRKYLGFYLIFLCVWQKTNVVGFRPKYRLIAYIRNFGYTTVVMISSGLGCLFSDVLLAFANYAVEAIFLYRRLLRHCALNCTRLRWLIIKVLSIVNEAKHKIIIILLSIFLIWCLFTIVTTMTTNEKQSKTISSYK